MISIIIPLYNAARFIEETLQSVQAQTYTDWECLVIDDGSTDNGAEMVQRMAQADTRIRYVHQSNAGPSAARNHGLRLAKGDYIQFLDADDWFPPQRFENMLAAYTRTEENVILYSGLCLGAEDDIHHHMPYSARTNVGDIDFKRMYGGFGREFSFIPGAILFPAAYLKNVQWDEAMRASEDWDYYLQLTQQGYTFRNLSEELFVYRLVGGGLSHNHVAVAKANYSLLQRYYRVGLYRKALMRTTSIIYANVLNIKHHRTTKMIWPHWDGLMVMCFLLMPIALMVHYITLRMNG